MNTAALRVSVSSGIVVLTGTVAVPAWRRRAQRIARAVRDVRAVVDRTSLVPVTRSDALLARDVRRAVRATNALRALPISVTVTDGVVELRGRISSWEEQQLAELVASSVPGVRFCQNQLSASADVVRTSAIVAGDIRTRLELDPLVRRAPIEVQVHGTTVWLSGRVGSAAESRRANALSWVKGVSRVDGSRLVVDELDRPNPNVRIRGLTDQEIRATLLELRGYWPSLAAARVEMSVLQGVVTLRGSVPTLAESRAFEALARSTVSVTAVQNQLRGPWWRPPAPPPAKPKRARPRSRR